MHPFKSTKSSWVGIHLDFPGPYKKMFLLLLDSYSKWLDVIPMSNTKTTSTIECLRQSFATHSWPFVKVTTNGPSFISNKFKTFVQKNGIKHIFRAPYTLLQKVFFEIGIHSLQDWTTTVGHGVTRKRTTKRLKHTGNLFRKNLQLKGVC